MHRIPRTFKPPSGARPNWGHPLAKDLVAFLPFTEGGGVPGAWIQGKYRRPDTNSLHSSATWEIRAPFGKCFRPATSANNSHLIWNNFPALGTGDFTAIGAIYTVVSGPSNQTPLSSGTYAPNWISVNATPYWRTYISGELAATTGPVADDVSVVVTTRDSGTASVEFSVSRIREGYNSGAYGTTQSGNTLNLNAATAAGAFGAQEHFSYYWIAVWHRKLPDAVITRFLTDWNYIWQLYSRPLPVWTDAPTAAAGWSKKIDGISSYTKIDGVTAASGITKVNGVSA